VTKLTEARTSSGRPTKTHVTLLNSSPDRPTPIDFGKRSATHPVLFTDNIVRLSRSGGTQTDQEMLFGLLTHSLDAVAAGRITETLLNRFGSFAEAIAASPVVLAGIEGMTDREVAIFKAIEMAAHKLGEASLKSQPVLKNWPMLTEYLNLTMGRKRNEVVKVLFLDTRNRLISDEILNEGDVSFVQMSPRKILARALEVNCTAMILAHNHPSGDPTPSKHDIDFTNNFCVAASYMELVVHDHVVVGSGRFFSFRQEGLMT